MALVLVATFAIRARLRGSPIVPLRQPLDRFPAEVGVWHLHSQGSLTADVLDVLKADDYMVRDYATAGGDQAQLFVAYYRSQRAGESMHSPKNCLPGAGWEPILSDEIPLASAPPGTMINRYVVENEGNRDLVLYWYQAQGRIIASEYWGKFYLVWDSMRDGRRDGAIVRVLAPMQTGESIEQATTIAMSLANPSLPLLGRFLPN
ncbi:MAG TPA: EpsI family protein [Terriglobales bacterium]|nr:EpsI family protein [Terriglobales bacterium]